MTPNNIVNMAKIKGLQAIALTDHNTTQNLPAISACAEREGLLLIPGIEVQSAEEVHLVCYFPSLEKAMEFGKIVEAMMDGIVIITSISVHPPLIFSIYSSRPT